MDRENKDLNLGDEATPAENGQSDKQNNASSDDSAKKPDDGQSGSGADEEQITLSKEEYEKLQRDRENYKKGMLSYKEKLNSQESKSSSDQEEKKEESDYISRKEFYKANEKEAIEKFVEENPEVEKNWDSLVKHYSGKRGKATVKDVLRDLDDAKTLYDKYNSGDDESDDKDKRADLAKEKSNPKSGKAKSGKKTTRKRVIPQKSTPDKWYE
ncbi:MAG: hypothetical protein ACOC5D_02760 [Thermoplasmatota archaeon]